MLEMRTVAPDEFHEWCRVEARSYGNRLDGDPEVLRPHFDLDRSIVVLDQGNIVGGAHSHRVEMSIPGASAMIAGVANIAVQPTHTRRGIMTKMLHHQIRDIHERGEPLAALFARESAIYRRFGYGIGSLSEQWMIDRHHNGFARPYERRGQINFVEPQDIVNELPEIFRKSTVLSSIHIVPL